MPKIQNFLQNLSSGQVRQSILDIDDSYNNDWDLLAELLQNSVDAIRKTATNEGAIQITVDCQNRAIMVKDNGVGIDADKLPTLVSMFGTDKREDETSIGEKGVGLKFAIFSCNDFYLKTGNEKGSSYAKVQDANAWKYRNDNSFLELDHDPLDEDFKGTEIHLKKINIDHLLFDLTFSQLKFILRTRTAIGNTNTIWDTSDININISLTFINADGVSTKETIPFKYWLPIEGLAENEKLNLSAYQDYVKEADRTDNQKRNKLKNKVIYWNKIFDLGNRTIKVFCCAVPGRAIWNEMSKSFNLASEENLKDGEWIDKFGYTILHPGIYMSVKGMPTGINIEPPTTGAAGNWAQMYLLFEDRKLKFDIGRKSIHGKTKNMYKEKARIIFNEYRTNLVKYITGDVSPESVAWDRDEMFKEIEGLVDIKSEATSFKKSPKDQEASVAALFFEAIGTGIIKEITPLISSYKNKYDLYALWGNKRIVIEFKSTIYKILKDWNDEQKMFNEINCIVCWDVSEEDEQVFKDVSIALEVIEPEGLLNKNLKRFPNATHTLRYSGYVEPIYVIDMKIVLKA
jgi:molecular chaperone HtpG